MALLPGLPGFFFQIRLSPTRTDAAARCPLSFALSLSAASILNSLARRAVARGYTWADLSITGEENPDTRPLALHLGALEYKRYRIYQKKFTQG